MMVLPPPSPKIAPPRPRGAIARPRLFDELAHGNAPVLWISAAPGAGKTTLAASYAEASHARVLWYHVDAGDTDPATVFYYMRQAAMRSRFAGASRLPLLPADSAVEIGRFARRYFRVLFSSVPRPALVVIDDFHAANDATFASILREAFEQLPEAVSVIVLSRSDPPSELARLVANGVIRAVPGVDLLLTRAESDQIVLSRLPDQGEGMSADLHQRSAGWAAGLVMMIEHIRRADGHSVPVAESQEAAFDYFAGEVLARFAADDQRALMLSASLPHVTASVVEAMSGHHDARRLLDELHQCHLFVERHPGSEPSYDYHGLFKAFLAAQARDRIPRTEVLDAAERAALLFEQDGQLDDAIWMHIAAADWAAAVRLIVQHAKRMYEQGRWRTLLDWIRALPPGTTSVEPWCAYWAGACQVWANAPVARAMLESAFQQFAVNGDVRGQTLAAGALTRACLHGTDWTLLDRWIHELEALLSTDTSGLPADVVLTGYSRLLYAAFARQPHRPELAAWADRAMALLGPDIDPSEAVLAAFSLLTYYAWTGQTSKADQVVRHVEPLASDAQLSPVSLVYWLWANASHVLHIGDPHEALALIDRAIELAAANGLTIAGVLRRHRVAYLLTLGRIREATAELDTLATAPRVEPYFEMRAWLALRQRDMALAVEEGQAALRMATERGRTFYQVLDHLLLAEICAASGTPNAALEHLRRYRELAPAAGELAEFQASMVEAYVMLKRGSEETREPLERALEIASRQRYRSCWGWDPTMVSPLLEAALGFGVCAAHCRDLIKTHRLEPDTPLLEHWPWPVTIRTLGRFEVQIDGVPLRFEGKAQRKPLELLKLMIALGNREVGIEHLVDLLWSNPDAGGRKAFDVTVHRLRKLLGFDAAIQVSDRHASLNARLVWVDAWVLDGMLASVLPTVGPPVAVEQLEEAAPRILDLYRGSFLGDDADHPWEVTIRNRLAGRFLRFAERLGEHWRRSHQWARAEGLYQRATELSPLAEVFYRGQMLCLRAQGRRAEAVEVFRRCRQLLSITLGVAPAPETEAIYRSLLDA